MIEVQNISFSYSSKSAPVFDEFCLQMEQNKVYGLLGENGTGKSTLLYLLMGLLRPDKGSIAVDGIDVSRRKRKTLQQMYIVPEEFDLPRMRFTDYVETYRPFYPAFSDDILRRCMEEFHLPLDARIDQFSMGNKKKALMSFTLATNVRYLLMDEPTNGLDVPSKKQFRKVIATTMTEERTLIMATHQLHDVEALLDHVIILNAHNSCSIPRWPTSAKSTPSTSVPTRPLPTKCSTPSAPHRATQLSPSVTPTTRKLPSTSNCCSMPLHPKTSNLYENPIQHPATLALLLAHRKENVPAALPHHLCHLHD